MSETPGHIDLREQMLDLATLPRALRALTAMTFVLIIAGVLLLLTRNVPGEYVSLGPMRGKEARISLPLFCYLYLMLLISWGCLIAGALRVRWWAGLPVLGLATIAHWMFTDLGVFSLGTLSLAGIWIYCLLRWSFWRRPGVWQDIAVVTVLLGIMYGWVVLSAVAEAFSTSGTVAVESALLLGSEISIIVFLMLPLLFLAGLDLGELSGQVGAWTVGMIAGRQPSRVVLGAAIVIATLLWAAYRVHTGYRYGPGTLSALVVYAVTAAVSWAFRRHPAKPREPSFALLLAMASLLFIVPTLLVLFSWLGVIPDVLLRRFRIEATWVLVGPIVVLAALPFLLRARRRGRPLPESALFMLVYGLWVLATIGSPLAWYGGKNGRSMVTIGQMDLALPVAATLAVVLLWRYKAGSAAYIFVAQVAVGMIAISGILLLYLSEVAVGDIYLLLQVALVLGAAVVGAVRAFRAARTDARHRRSRWALAAAAAALLVLVLLMIGEMAGIVPSRWALSPDIVSLLVIILALIWDILLSGERFTNGDTSALPRAARVTLYLGYVLLVTSLLLWSSGQQGADPFIDDSMVASLGLMTLGVPVFLFVSAAAGSRLWQGPHGTGTGAPSLSGTIREDIPPGGDA